MIARFLKEDVDPSLPSVFCTYDISPAGLLSVFQQIDGNIRGKVAIKLSTVELNGPNILPRELIKELQSVIPNSSIVECNTAYEGSSRKTTATHITTARINGFDFCPVDIMDAGGDADLPIKDGNHLKSIPVGRNLLKYDSMLVYTHFKGHAFAGFGGALKNIGIGCASSRGKEIIHGDWKPSDKFLERMVESGKATADHFGNNITYINVLKNISVDCDCDKNAAPPVCPDICILGSTDILAIDQASVDMVYNLKTPKTKDIIERIESRNGLHQLDYMEKLGMGSRKYNLISLDD